MSWKANYFSLSEKKNSEIEKAELSVHTYTRQKDGSLVFFPSEANKILFPWFELRVSCI